jgi:hypothetical protein
VPGSAAAASPWAVPARVVLLVVGAVAIAWGGALLPGFWRQAALDRIATHIVHGEPFKLDALVALTPSLPAAGPAADCRAAAVRSAAIIRLRIAEATIAAGERSLIDDRMRALDDGLRRSLACAPADPFLWLALYWVEVARNGFTPDDLAYLRMSYRLGPNEGWIGLKRIRLALAIYGQLPPDLAEMTVREFVGLLDSGFYLEMAAVLTGPGWNVRDVLLPRLKDASEQFRRALARELYRGGYDVAVPGIERPDSRPWH